MSAPRADGRRPLSAVLITLDAERHLDRVLAAAAEVCDELVVLDSGSRDATCDIARRHGARVAHQDFLGFGPQKRRAVELARHDWVLCLDADEVLDEEARRAIRALPLDDPQRCWRLRRRTFVGGREVRYGVWHPDRVVRLFNRTATTFSHDLVHESVPPAPRVADLPGSLLHHSFGDLAELFTPRYHRLKADRYRVTGRRAGTPALCVRAAFAFLRSFVLKRGFLDGPAGVVVALSASVNAVLGLAMAGWETPDDGREAGDEPRGAEAAARAAGGD